MKVSKFIIYIIIIISIYILGFISNKQETKIVTIPDSLKITSMKFQLDSIKKSIVAKVDTSEKIKPKIIIKWYPKYIKGDTIKIFQKDTVYKALFEISDKYIKIWGHTEYHTSANNTFDIHYIIHPRDLRAETFWTNGQIFTEVYEGDIKLKIKNKIDYKEYNLYVKSLKPKWYEAPMFVIPVTFTVTLLGVWGLNNAID